MSYNLRLKESAYVKELFGILEAGGEKQLDLHLACMPNLNKQECILFLGLAYHTATKNFFKNNYNVVFKDIKLFF